MEWPWLLIIREADAFTFDLVLTNWKIGTESLAIFCGVDASY